jgi:uncharacterized membrane protein YcaP (DUF421 family)
MDPFRIIVRVLIAYSFMLLLLRICGKRTVRHATAFDFVLSLIVGDLVDDLLWAEVSAAKFFVATSVLTIAH